MVKKILDVLIPAYGNPRGVEKILALVSKNELANIIVSDDSFKKSDVSSIKGLCSHYGAIYKTGTRSGAVTNWNFLLSQASCEYCVLVHHDECFSNTRFIYRLEEMKTSIEVMVLPVVVKHPNNISRYVYSWQQNLFILWFKRFNCRDERRV